MKQIKFISVCAPTPLPNLSPNHRVKGLTAPPRRSYINVSSTPQRVGMCFFIGCATIIIYAMLKHRFISEEMCLIRLFSEGRNRLKLRFNLSKRIKMMLEVKILALNLQYIK